MPLPQARYNNEAQARFYSQLFETLRDNPITARSALVFPTPFGGGNAAGGYIVEGAPPRPRAERPLAQLSSVTPGLLPHDGYSAFERSRRRRSDTRDRRKSCVVNQTLADREWPGQDPIGKRIAIGGDPTDPTVVDDGRRRRRRFEAQRPPVGRATAVYLSHTAFTLPFMGAWCAARRARRRCRRGAHRGPRSLDPELPVGDVETSSAVLERATGQPRFRAFLIAAFAAVALLLAAVGLYGLISYTVAQRVPEIGVRLALGATPSQVGAAGVRPGAGPRGRAASVSASSARSRATRLLEGLLFSVSATDPTVYAGARRPCC